MSDPDNIFDEDNALDYIIYEECEKDIRNAFDDRHFMGHYHAQQKTDKQTTPR